MLSAFLSYDPGARTIDPNWHRITTRYLSEDDFYVVQRWLSAMMTGEHVIGPHIDTRFNDTLMIEFAIEVICERKSDAMMAKLAWG